MKDNMLQNNEDDLKVKVYERISLQYGANIANKVYDNWDIYKYKVQDFYEEQELLSIYNQTIELNKKALLNIAINGEYFNNKQSSFYSNSQGYLVFEDESRKKKFITKIHYKDFKYFVQNNLEEIAEIFVYIDTTDIVLMDKNINYLRIEDFIMI